MKSTLEGILWDLLSPLLEHSWVYDQCWSGSLTSSQTSKSTSGVCFYTVINLDCFFFVKHVIFQMIISRDIDVMSISGHGHHWAVATTWKSCSIYLNSFINKSKHDCYLITKTAFSMVKSPGKCRRYKKIKRNSLEKKWKQKTFLSILAVYLFFLIVSGIHRSFASWFVTAKEADIMHWK